jgi:hypothetical protein
MARLSSYFTYFFETEFAKSERWERSLHLAPSEELVQHTAAIETKRCTYMTCKEQISEAFRGWVTTGDRSAGQASSKGSG